MRSTCPQSKKLATILYESGPLLEKLWYFRSTSNDYAIHRAAEAVPLGAHNEWKFSQDMFEIQLPSFQIADHNLEICVSV
jgi:hypothetical protein